MEMSRCIQKVIILQSLWYASKMDFYNLCTFTKSTACLLLLCTYFHMLFFFMQGGLMESWYFVIRVPGG